MTSFGLRRYPVRPLRDAAGLVLDLIGPARHGTVADAASPASADWIALLCLNAAIALLLIALGQGAGRRGDAYASLLFWSGVVLLLLPTAGRIAWPATARSERMFLLVLLVESLFAYRLLYAPTSFVDFDSILHWISAQDVLHRHKLFLDNPLLPISPYYPALEIVTTALASLAGLSVFPAAMLFIAVLRATFIVALFLFFEQLSRSPRIAAISCLVYMGCDNFVTFDAIFAYETLGIVLCVLVMLVEAKAAGGSAQGDVRGHARPLVLIAMLLASLAVTHHVSSFACALYLTGVLVLEMLRRDSAQRPSELVVPQAAAAIAVAFPLLWIHLTGDRLIAYLAPRIDLGVISVAGLLAKFHGGAGARHLFVAANGLQQPLGYRVIGVAWTLLLALGLASGFFRCLAMAAAAARPGWLPVLQIGKRRWRDSRLVLLTLAAFGFPLSVAFRLTPAGWEIGNRMGTFVFVAVGIVVGVGIVHFWQSRPSPWRLATTTLALGTILLGGITIGSAFHALRGGYQPGADAPSIEPMGIDAADWTKAWLGEGNRFAADRDNRLLLAAYGQQDPISSINDRLDESRIFLADRISPDVLYWIRHGRIDYLLADLRITTAPAVLGHYYESFEPNAGLPPPPSMLLKFDGAANIGRVFDDGWIVIFDVRALHARQ